MVIDFHTHIFPDRIAAGAVARLSGICGARARTDGTAEGLFRSMRRGGVDLSVLQPVVTKPAQARSVNDFSAGMNGREGIAAFGGLHPDCEDWKEELARIKALGLKGVKLHPDYQNTYIDDPRYVHILRECGRLGLVALIHAGVDIGYPEPVHCTPERVRSILPDIKGTVLVCAHYGGHEYFEDSLKYLADTDVYIDTSYSYMEFKEACGRVLAAFDADRILFGSDSPWADPGEGAAYIRCLGFPADKEEKILWKNAARLLKLSGALKGCQSGPSGV